MRVLLVEDEGKLAQAVAQCLAGAGHEVLVAGSGEEGYFLATTETVDLMVLDLNLPARDGLTILRSLRARGWIAPVLVLTARDSVQDRVDGLDAGADDYLIKPFAVAELQARVRALTRRPRMDAASPLRCADLEMERLARKVTRAGQPIELTAKEFDLLEYLLLNQGHVVSRDMLARELWQERSRAVAIDNVIDVHVARLRAKVDAPFERALIRTLRGVGFVLREDD